ncbi:MAG: hypothetical protein FK734_09270 [Asgard group archaeon]|nr:hypothetical protein [Asgard group archaeon]
MNNFLKILLYGCIFTIISSVFIVNISLPPSSEYFPSSSQTISVKAEESPDPLAFWTKEILRVENTPYNLSMGENETRIFDEGLLTEFNVLQQEFFFDSPNWVNASPATIRLHGFILTPEGLGGQNPGVLGMHGLFYNASPGLITPYLRKGFVGLVFSFPGHGESEGAVPLPENIYLESLTQYNTSSHFYLSLCGAIQALRILGSLPTVNASQIMVTGVSYGAIISMKLAAIYGNAIAGVLPYDFAGDFSKIKEYEESFLLYIWGQKLSEIPEQFYSETSAYIDPFRYLQASNITPPLFWIAGTNDEFFSIEMLTSTFDAITGENEKFLSIVPNKHHEGWATGSCIDMFIDYIIFAGPRPPTVQSVNYTKDATWRGSVLKIEVEIQVEGDPASVEVWYKFQNMLGIKWQKISMTKSNDNGGNQTWIATLNPALLSSPLNFYITVNLDGQDLYFSSKTYSTDFKSNLMIPFYVFIGLILLVPLVFIIKWRLRKDMENLDPSQQLAFKKNLLVEVCLIAGSDILFIISLVLPLARFKYSGITITADKLFDSYYTWDSFLGGFSSYLGIIFVLLWFIGFYLAYFVPKIASIIRLLYPLLTIVFLLLLIQSVVEPGFGSVYIDYGWYVLLISALLPFIVGLVMKKQRKKLVISAKPEKV